MSYPNCLPPDSFNGTVAGIAIDWHHLAQTRLNDDAEKLDIDPIKVKAATEHLAHASAQRLRHPSVMILGTFHAFTIGTGTGATVADGLHITAQMPPKGKTKVHIYVDLNQNGATIDTMQVIGESVTVNQVKKPEDSVGTYTFHR